MSIGEVSLVPKKKKKRFTERNSHLAGAVSGRSIANSYKTETKRRRQLGVVLVCKRATKLHANVVRFCVQTLHATPAPRKPDFTDSPRNLNPLNLLRSSGGAVRRQINPG